MTKGPPKGGPFFYVLVPPRWRNISSGEDTLNALLPFGCAQDPFSSFKAKSFLLCREHLSSERVPPSGNDIVYRSPSAPQTSHSYNSTVFRTIFTPAE